jgi:hypothetical protein
MQNIAMNIGFSETAFVKQITGNTNSSRFFYPKIIIKKIFPIKIIRAPTVLLGEPTNNIGVPIKNIGSPIKTIGEPTKNIGAPT